MATKLPNVRSQVAWHQDAVMLQAMQSRSAHRSRSVKTWELEQLDEGLWRSRVTRTLALRCSSAALLPCLKDSSAVSVAPLPFEDVLGNVSSRLGFAYVNALALCCEPHVAPQLLVSKTNRSNQCNGAEQKATKKPSRPVMAFVGSNVTGVKGAGQPNEKQREQEAHHQSVTGI